MKKSVELKYGEEKVNLRFTTRSLIALEEDVEMSTQEFINKIDTEGRFADFTTFLYYALIHEKKELTAEDTMDLLDDILEELSLLQVGSKLGIAYGIAVSGKLPEQQEKEVEVKKLEAVESKKRKAPSKSPVSE